MDKSKYFRCPWGDLTGMHDAFVDLHVGLGREPLGAVLALEALLALVNGPNMMSKFGPGTGLMKFTTLVNLYNYKYHMRLRSGFIL